MRPTALLLVVCVARAAAHPDYSDTWEEYKQKFGKEYQSEDEESYRRDVWAGWVKFYDSHNAEADSVHGYRVGENHLADLTTEEITARYNGLVTDSPAAGAAQFSPRLSNRDLPASVNWTARGRVTPVKNQGHCGSCWAFSATGSLEGAHAAKAGKLVSLSEQNLVDCAKKQGNHGCAGGLMDFAFKYVKENGGIDTETSYPYTGKTGPKCLYNATDSGANLTSWTDIPRGSEQDLQKAVATIGPISVAIDASRPTFHFYKSGVYHDLRCSSHKLDHGVLAVGYGVEGGTASQNSHLASTTAAPWPARDYWLVKNSWGEKWGMAGYVKMARNRLNACGIATQASFPVV